MSRRHRGESRAVRIRKRDFASPSSSLSSYIQKYRLKRAVSVCGRISSPVPAWKITEMPSKPLIDADLLEDTERRDRLSARKLAASLLETSELSSGKFDESPKCKKKERLKTRRARSRCSSSSFLFSDLSDPSHSPVSEKFEQYGSSSISGRVSSISQRRGLFGNTKAMEIESSSGSQTPSRSSVEGKIRLKDVSNALSNSRQLLKIINRLLGHEERPLSTSSLMLALCAELDRARVQVSRLIKEDNMKKDTGLCYFSRAKSHWKTGEEETVLAAMKSAAIELKAEKKMRQGCQSLNDRLEKELIETKASLFRTEKELEKEKEARSMMEEACGRMAAVVDGSEVKQDRKEVDDGGGSHRHMSHTSSTRHPEIESSFLGHASKSKSRTQEEEEEEADNDDDNNNDLNDTDSDSHYTIDFDTSNRKEYILNHAHKASRQMRKATKAGKGVRGHLAIGALRRSISRGVDWDPSKGWYSICNVPIQERLFDPEMRAFAPHHACQGSRDLTSADVADSFDYYACVAQKSAPFCAVTDPSSSKHVRSRSHGNRSGSGLVAHKGGKKSKPRKSNQ